ncbi:hypothetical protein O1M54_23870 [Streptomyces diastatochromogenes]|nr:hypothetical protein [Streptomyces diastatochromogenes]
MKVSGLDASNRAGAGAVRVDATATARTTEATQANTRVTSLAYSTDDGASWTDLPVTDGAATLDVPVTASFLSLRAVHAVGTAP